MIDEHQVAETIHQVQTAHGAAHAEAHELPNFITVLNHFFPENNIAHFFHQWENVFFSALAVTVILTTAIWAARKKNLVPRGLENFGEVLVEGIDTFVCGILGPHGREHVPFLGTIFVYILLQNWFGLIPFFKSPTASWGTTIAIALVTTVYVQYTGIRTQGPIRYLKHLAGNPSNVFGVILIPLMLVINLTVEYLAVPLSLSLRLFANISSEDRLLFKFAELNILFKGAPFFFQIFANVLSIAFSVVQAFVFMLLSTVYISLVLPHDQHEHGDETHAHAH